MTRHHEGRTSPHIVDNSLTRNSPRDDQRPDKTSLQNRCHRNHGMDSSDMEEDSDPNSASGGSINNNKSSYSECQTSTSSVNESNECETLFGINSCEHFYEREQTKSPLNGVRYEREQTKSPLNGVRYSVDKDNVSLDRSIQKSTSRSSLSNMSGSDYTEPEVKGFSWRKMSRDQIIILISTCSTSLVSFLSLSILAPFFPLEADKKNVNSTISGWIFGVYSLVQFIASPFFGHLMPKVGSRFMYISGLFVCAGCSLLFGVLDRVDTSEDITLFVVLCLLTRILLALGTTGVNNAAFVFIIKYFPDNIATMFGVAEVFTGVGLVTGPALGGFLYSAGGFFLPFAVVSGCCFVALPLIWFFFPQQDDSQTQEESEVSVKEILLHSRSIVNSLVIVVGTAVWSVLDPTLEPHLRVYGLGPELVGLLFLIMAAVYSVTSPIWGHVADQLPDNRILLIPGLLISTVGLLLIGPSPALGFELSYNKLWLTIVSLVLLGIGCSMSSIPTFDVYIDVLEDLGCPENTRTYGMVSGLWVSMYALGDFTGPIMGGFLFDTIGFEWLVTWIGAACVLVVLILAVTWGCEKRCCRGCLLHYDNRKSEERTPLLIPAPNLDVLNTYPPGSTYGSSQSSV